MPSKVVARRSKIHGTGVFAIADIAKGERIIEYKGMRRTHEDVDSSDVGAAESGHTFLFTLNDEYVIDGDIQGGVARWINHGCSPNCEAVLIEHPGEDRRKDRIFIEAKRAIKAGEELTYDYGITLGEPHTPRMKKIWACLCGARNCTGTMLKPKRAVAKKAPAKAKKAASKKAATKGRGAVAKKGGTKVARRGGSKPGAGRGARRAA
ncbi:SET domain-containing protein-lysine N-methyltransferase [Lysobacter sp. N42]|nr:SET domain-containing protein-lysine N-methyltransferase [Lysobacter sp. N42]